MSNLQREIGKNVIAAIPHFGFVLAKMVMVKNVDSWGDMTYIVEHNENQYELSDDELMSLSEMKANVTQFGVQYVSHILKNTPDTHR